MPRTYDLPDLPWETIAGRLEQVTIGVLRFDARLEASDLAAGWQSRCDMTEAVRALILDGHLVDVGDLVLHDAGMDVRHPTHELTRAAAALRARRTAMARKAPWPLSIDGLAALRGIGGLGGGRPARSKGKRPDPDDDEAYPPLCQRCRSVEGALCRDRCPARPHQQGARRRDPAAQEPLASGLRSGPG